MILFWLFFWWMDKHPAVIFTPQINAWAIGFVACVIHDLIQAFKRRDCDDKDETL